MKPSYKKPVKSADELRAEVLVEINANAIPKCKPSETPIVLCRNGRPAVKRAKREHKEFLERSKA